MNNTCDTFCLTSQKEEANAEELYLLPQSDVFFFTRTSFVFPLPWLFSLILSEVSHGGVELVQEAGTIRHTGTVSGRENVQVEVSQ